jgi:hypothetical protein
LEIGKVSVENAGVTATPAIAAIFTIALFAIDKGLRAFIAILLTLDQDGLAIHARGGLGRIPLEAAVMAPGFNENGNVLLFVFFGVLHGELSIMFCINKERKPAGPARFALPDQRVFGYFGHTKSKTN